MTEAETQFVSIVVVTYNSAERLEGFFGSLPDGLKGVRRYEVIVADNASSDGTRDVVQQVCPDAKVVALASNRGYSAGINAAVQVSEPSSAILVLNDDIRLKPNSVIALLDELRDPTVGVTVPLLRDGSGHLLLSQRREPTVASVFAEAVLGGTRASRMGELGEVVGTSSAYEHAADVVWASGCAWLIERSCWNAVGEWDESFFLYAEDLDYALRVRDAGLRIRFTPKAEAIHLVGPSQRDPRLWSMSVWNRYRLFARRHGWVKSRMFWLGLVLNEAIRSIKPGSIHRAGLAALVFPSKRPPEVRGTNGTS